MFLDPKSSYQKLKPSYALIVNNVDRQFSRSAQLDTKMLRFGHEQILPPNMAGCRNT